jgi:DNA-binding CsgD family transcriptional regulator
MTPRIRLTHRRAEDRARDIAILRANGKSPQDIADILGVTKQLVCYYQNKHKGKASIRARVFPCLSP